jgi:hypothetical protein
MVLKFFLLLLCISFIPITLALCMIWMAAWSIVALLWFALGIGFYCAGFASLVGFFIFMPLAQITLELLNDSGILGIIGSGPEALLEMWQNKYNDILYYNPQNFLY